MPSNPCTPGCGYGFSAGTEFPTRTRTPGLPMAFTHGFFVPVAFPTINGHEAGHLSKDSESQMLLNTYTYYILAKH